MSGKTSAIWDEIQESLESIWRACKFYKVLTAVLPTEKRKLQLIFLKRIAEAVNTSSFWGKIISINTQEAVNAIK